MGDDPQLWGGNPRWDLGGGGGQRGGSICLLKEDPLLPTEQQLVRALQVEGGEGSLELTMLLKSDLLPKACGCLLLELARFQEYAALHPPVLITAGFPN